MIIRTCLMLCESNASPAAMRAFQFVMPSVHDIAGLGLFESLENLDADNFKSF